MQIFSVKIKNELYKTAILQKIRNTISLRSGISIKNKIILSTKI